MATVSSNGGRVSSASVSAYSMGERVGKENNESSMATTARSNVAGNEMSPYQIELINLHANISNLQGRILILQSKNFSLKKSNDRYRYAAVALLVLSIFLGYKVFFGERNPKNSRFARWISALFAAGGVGGVGGWINLSENDKFLLRYIVLEKIKQYFGVISTPEDPATSVTGLTGFGPSTSQRPALPSRLSPLTSSSLGGVGADRIASSAAISDEE